MTLENESGREYPSNILAVGGWYILFVSFFNQQSFMVLFDSRIVLIVTSDPVIYIIILLKSACLYVCRCSQTTGRSSCSFLT